MPNNSGSGFLCLVNDWQRQYYHYLYFKLKGLGAKPNASLVDKELKYKHILKETNLNNIIVTAVLDTIKGETMTAEVAVLNKNAVALAADSAATIKYKGGAKIFKNANKLFTLSKYEPVGIMINGGASMMHVPWELLVKGYRTQLERKAFPTIKDYAIDFTAYVSSFFDKSQQDNYFVFRLELVYGQIWSEIDSAIKRRFAQGPVDTAEIALATSEKIQMHFAYWSSQPDYNIDQDVVKNIRGNKEQIIKTRIEEVFKGMPLSGEDRKMLLEIGHAICTKENWDFSTGIAIAGYGTTELFPSIVSMKTDFIVENQLKFGVDKIYSVCHEEPINIFAFAQREMVIGFIEGADPGYQSATEFFIQKLMESLPNVILDKLKVTDENERNQIETVINELTERVYNSFTEATRAYRQDKFIDPVREAVQYMDKAGLASMAETLVNLTSFKKEVTMTDETVGGPIDVAVISKYDGFIWIKRKLYFEAPLNPRFFNTYYKDKIQEG